jgi:hypothetical protein
MKLHSFSEQGLQDSLDDISVEAEGVDRNIVDSYKKSVRSFIPKVANYFGSYRNRVSEHLSHTYHRIRDLGRRGAQYLPGVNLQEVDSRTFHDDPAFADEGIGHELVHSGDDATGGWKERFERGIEGTRKYGLWFFYAMKNMTEGMTTAIWQDITGKRSKSLYSGLGLDKAADYILKRYGDRAIRPGNQQLFENMVFDYVGRAGNVYAI